MKSPEEYFSDCNFSETEDKGTGFTSAEQAFIEKYMGADAGAILAGLNLPASAPAPQIQPEVAAPAPQVQPLAAAPAQQVQPEITTLAPQMQPEVTAPAPQMQSEVTAPAPQMQPKVAAPAPQAKVAATARAQAETSKIHFEQAEALTTYKEPENDGLYQNLREATDLLMVGFYLGNQEFVVPVAAVQEVIRTQPIAKLPASPPLVAGVINLRGQVTPLIMLRHVLEVPSPRQSDDNFIIVCRRLGLQVGLLVERIHTMYRVPQTDIDWNIEAHLGVTTDLIAGVVKLREQLVSIVYVDKIVTSIL
ncbi:chemotaxis protein CheW [Desulfovibrio cuneatus]|uniref:chemotaxis protein CheW n=1 Tax=Desulfovibrio cuneatus TaxID=159728 RepID=UPI0003FE4D6B|nr:chemotaxis protein CheW [Desulfovibrio cuneatus]